MDIKELMIVFVGILVIGAVAMPMLYGIVTPATTLPAMTQEEFDNVNITDDATFTLASGCDSAEYPTLVCSAIVVANQTGTMTLTTDYTVTCPEASDTSLANFTILTGSEDQNITIDSTCQSGTYMSSATNRTIFTYVPMFLVLMALIAAIGYGVLKN